MIIPAKEDNPNANSSFQLAFDNSNIKNISVKEAMILTIIAL